MAFSSTPAAAEYVKQGPTGVGDVYSGKRKYSLSDQIVYQERAYAMLDTILRMEAKTVTVNDPEPKVLTMQETPVRFAVGTQSTSEGGYDDNVVGIADANALFLQAGDILVAPDVFCDSTGANYSTTKGTYPAESVIVESVTLSGLSSGQAKVVLARGNGSKPTSSVTTLTTSMYLIHIGNALVDGGNAPNPISHEPTDVQNYCQFFSETWGVTTSEKPLDVYGKMTPQQRAEYTRRKFFRKHEAAMFFGRKAVITQAGGSKQWLTGGMHEFVPLAATALDGETRDIDFGGAFDLGRLRELTERIYRYGNSQKVKHWFCGGKFYTYLYNALEKFIHVNDEYSRRYGWAVYELELGNGIAMLHRHPLLTDMSTTGNEYGADAMIIDLDFIKLMNYIDVSVRQLDPGRAHRDETELYCQNGLWRTFPDAHARIFGITS